MRRRTCKRKDWRLRQNGGNRRQFVRVQQGSSQEQAADPVPGVRRRGSGKLEIFCRLSERWFRK